MMAALPLVMLRAPAESVALNAPVLLFSLNVPLATVKALLTPNGLPAPLASPIESALTDEGRPGVGVAGAASGLIEDYRSRSRLY